MLLKSYGEFNLIRHIRNRVYQSHPDVVVGIGDDTAVTRPTAGMLQLSTTDTFVESLDFDLDLSTWFHIGWKSMAANLSDIAAMGGTPRYALVTLCLQEDRTVEDIDAFCDGMMDLMTRFEVMIIGGDISGTPGPAMVSITLLGEADENRVLRRNGAQVGDLICVTGQLGASEAGLRLLQARKQNPVTTTALDDFGQTIAKHRTPLPRGREAQIIGEAHTVHAMIDISDGLSADILHISQSSQVGVMLDARLFPIQEETCKAAKYLDIAPSTLALISGEEFELLCTVAPNAAASLCQHIMETTETPMTIIGEVVPESDGHKWCDHNGAYPLIPSGYDHFGKQESGHRDQGSKIQD